MKKVLLPIGKFLVLDLETSGLPSKNTCGHQVTNLVHYNSCRIMSLCYGIFDSIDNFDKSKLTTKLISHSIDYKPNEIALKVNKLTKAQCQKGVSIAESGILEALSDCETIVSYNVAFDYNVLMSELLRYDYDIPPKLAFCAMEHVTRVNRLEKNIKLIDACKLYLNDDDIASYNFHDAIDDVAAMCEVLKFTLKKRKL
jgi:DNA polymerase III epsilon subunit-like protein